MNKDFPPEHGFSQRTLFALLTFGLCLAPVVAAVAPRFLAFMPGVLAVVGLALYRRAYGGWPSFSKPLFFWFAAITGLCALSALWGIGGISIVERAAGIGLVLFSGLGLITLADAVPRQNPARFFLVFFPAFFLVGALLCVTDLYSEGMIYQLLHGHEESGGFNLSRLNRSVVAVSFLSFPALLAAWRGSDETWRRYGVAAAILVVMGAILYKTESQSAQLGIAAGIAFLAFFPYRRRVAWLALTLVIIFLTAISPFLAQWMFSALAELAQENPWLARGYAADRMEIWDFVARKAMESPLYGFGLEATREVEHFDAQRLYTPLDHVLHPHNALLQIWIEFGAIGAVTASGFLAFILRSLYVRPLADQRLALPVFMAALAGAAVSYGLWQGWWLGLFVLLAVCCRILFSAEKLKT